MLITVISNLEPEKFAPFAPKICPEKFAPKFFRSMVYFFQKIFLKKNKKIKKKYPRISPRIFQSFNQKKEKFFAPNVYHICS